MRGRGIRLFDRAGNLGDGARFLQVADAFHVPVIFLADNPGIWMDHCHNLPHAVEGLMTHLMDEGVTTPFLLGTASGNEPE